MNEFDWRPKCDNCDGIGCSVTECPTLAHKVLKNYGRVWVVECYLCKGEGRLPMIERVELEKKK